MKQFKNLTLAVMGGLLVLTMATMSCSKHNSSAPVPTVTGATPTTASVGDTLTVTGTGFTSGSTATINGTAATVIFVSSTEIKVVVLSGSTTGTLVASNGGSIGTVGTTVTIVAGITSNSVASSNLLAHWTFDTNSAEQGSGDVAATTVGSVVYTNPGRIGNCATFTAGALVYNPISQLNNDTALQSYTVSMWVKFPTNDGSHWRSLWQLNSNAYTDLFGIIGIQALNERSGDTLALQVDNTQIDATGVHTAGYGCGGCFNGAQVNLTNPIIYATDTTAWTLLTTTYNGSSTSEEELAVYANGTLLDSMALTNVTKPGGTQTTFRIVPAGGTTAPIPSAWANLVTIGTFNWSDFTQFSNSDGYGNYSATAASRAGYMSNGITGKMDDIRVYNKALTVAQIDSLYTLGNAGK